MKTPQKTEECIVSVYSETKGRTRMFVCLCVNQSVNILSNLTLSGQTTLGIGLSDSAVNIPYCSLAIIVQVNAHLYKV